LYFNCGIFNIGVVQIDVDFLLFFLLVSLLLGRRFLFFTLLPGRWRCILLLVLSFAFRCLFLSLENRWRE
jgi:hypothetical protein